MSAEDKLRDGLLDEALAELQQQVRREPGKAAHRVFLFQLLTVLGQWDRAATQLSVAGELDPANLAMVQTYREALRDEALRREIFAGRRSPLIFGDPDRWIALLVQALQLEGAGANAQAAELRAEAFDEAPATAGTWNGSRFEWIADADSRLGPVLEVMLTSGYYWVPLHRIRRIHVDAPTDLRDVVWMPAQFTWANGGEAIGLIPTRYVGSETSPDARIRLSRMTQWAEPSPGVYMGEGQRLLATDAGEYALMDTRVVELEVAETGTEATATAGTSG